MSSAACSENQINEPHSISEYTVDSSGKLSNASATQINSADPEDIRALTSSSGALPGTGIDRLPTELVLMIFEWILDNLPPSFQLALVCKRWKNFMLSSPSLWRNITVRPVRLNDEHAGSYLQTLRRRIQLAGSMLLNVTLKVCYYSGNRHSVEPFKIVATTGIERWQHLTLLCGRRDPVDLHILEDIFTGSFTSLRTFSCDAALPVQKPFIPLARLIAKSRPPLREVFLGCAYYPQEFHNSVSFHDVQKLSTNPRAITGLAPFPRLEELNLFLHDNVSWSPALLPPLPPRTSIGPGLARFQLALLQLHQVEYLTTDTLIRGDYKKVIEFPKLRSLTIQWGTAFSFQGLLTPKLEVLQLGLNLDGFRCNSDPVENNSLLLQDEPETPLMNPTSADFGVYIHTPPILFLLRKWPQLQHLSMRLHEASWDTFLAEFRAGEGGLCPNLITLRLHLLSYQTIKASDLSHCEEFVESIYSSRGGRPLKRVEWIPYHHHHKEFNWYKLWMMEYPPL